MHGTRTYSTEVEDTGINVSYPMRHDPLGTMGLNFLFE